MFNGNKDELVTNPHHFASAPEFCYDGTCKKSSKYYGNQDITTNGTTISSCVYYFFKRPTVFEKRERALMNVNNKISSNWGDCMLYDKAYQDHDLGFKDGVELMKSNSLLQVGIHRCHEGSLIDPWSYHEGGKRSA